MPQLSGSTPDAECSSPMLEAFLNSEQEIFRSVAYPTEVWKEDLCDVETIHGAAREVFDVLLSQAVAPEHAGKVGRILLLLGESGAGKTHLMRAFRTRTHSGGAGYFGYMQMTSLASNYSRYVLRMLIDSLQKPYSPLLMDDEPRGLKRISDAVAGCVGADPKLLHRLRTEDLPPAELSRIVHELTIGIVNGSLRTTNPDLVRAMLFLQTENAHAHGLVIKYLRAESLSAFDQNYLAGITPLDGEEDPLAMILGLGNLIWKLHRAALVICVDQIEDMLFDRSEEAEAEARFSRALTTLKQIAEQLPSAIVIVSCLEDFYDEFRDRLPRPLRERIQTNPEPITLVATRNRGEVNDLIEAQLAQLVDMQDPDSPDQDAHGGTYPLPEELLHSVTGLRSRDVLEACRRYREKCMAAGYLVACEPNQPTKPPGSSSKVAAFEAQWNDFVAAWETEPSEQDDDLIQLLNRVLQVVSEEHNGLFRFDTEASGRFLSFVSDSHHLSRRAAICNKSPLGGGLTKQVRELRESTESMPRETQPIIVRTNDYRPKTPSSLVAKEYAAVVRAGGFSLTIDDSDWRRMAAFMMFQQQHGAVDGFAEWQATMKPLSRLDSLCKLLALDRVPGPKPATGADETDLKPTPDDEQQTVGSETAVTTATSGPPAPAPLPSTALIAGRTTSGDRPVEIEVEALKTHAAFLGGTGSGKTTAALNLIEQLLLKNIPVVLVDRKGDLAAFASDQMWSAHLNSDNDELRNRGARLKERLDVALFTPGQSDGNPLALSIVPDRIHEMPDGERQIICRSAADALGQIMGYGKSSSAQSRISVLIQAIEVLAQREMPITLDTLIELIYDPDDQLLSVLGVLDPKICPKVAENLQMLRINHQHLFPEGCDTLNADLLFGRGSWRVPDKTRLSIISTKFLGGEDATLFWVAQLLFELSRWCSRHPSESLQAAVLFDEADLYLPATSKPATKQPMESLLKRARSAGLGIFLATQSPADMDYRCRDNIHTWMLGKIKEQKAIEKLKPLLSSLRTDVSRKLETQDTGQFFLSQSGDVTRLQSHRSFMETSQLSEQEILDLAARQRLGTQTARSSDT
ncbi:MAG: DUF87 domain-containing protein [Fuerstiella sp.]